MFRHQGKTRTLKHNLQIASLLSFVAGIVNVTGFLSVQRLTTNVTGHFAFFVDELLGLHFRNAVVFSLYIFFFFLGSFVSGFLVEFMTPRSDRHRFVIPVLIESIILLSVALTGQFLMVSYPDLLAFSLLFAMGLQNSLVTSISHAIVRTTHLTGLFTDLGIELSQLFFYKEKIALYSSIRLRLTIIACFLLGGVTGGMAYTRVHFVVLAIAALTLVVGLIYDNVKVKVLLLKRNFVNHNSKRLPDTDE